MLLTCSAAPALAENLRLRIAWGGGAERIWQGRIAVSEGRVSEPVPLGIEADEVGSMWLARGQPEIASLRKDRGQSPKPPRAAAGFLAIRQRSPRTYDAVDLSVDAPLGASLRVELLGVDDKQPPGRVEIRLADVLHGPSVTRLDDQGNRLVVRRAPGDEFRVRLPPRSTPGGFATSLVYAPGEILKFDLQPHLLAADRGNKTRIKIQLCPARTAQELRSKEYTIAADQPPVLPVEMPLNVPEGAYDIVITAAGAGRILRSPLSFRTPLAERTIQVLVLDPRPKAADAGPGPSLPSLSVVQEIDPANPRWWAKFPALPSLARRPKFSKGRLGNGMLRSWQHPLGQLAQLAPSAKSPDVSWEAYPLPLRPGEPHVLEIEYPSDVPQTLAISIIEPDAAGAAIPVGLDSGIDQAEDVIGLRPAPQWLRHRIIFWPRSETAVLLIANLRDQRPAVYGKIRVLAGWRHLPRAVGPGEPKPTRLWAGYMDKPLVPENFSASEAPGSTRDLSIDDWVTFYEGGTRMVEYLQHVGYGGLMLSVFADGSTIYPSAIVQPTPRYDTGMFLASGQDPARKDVLEMLLRLFDREGLALVPAVEFASPLPELEAVLRRGGPEAEGIRWIGPDGASWQEVHPATRGRAPYYNVLHPRVQEAMLAVVRELVSTYGAHPSFSGLGLQLSSRGYAQLLGPAWGMDDATIDRFQRATGIRVPGEGAERFFQRARFLIGEKRSQWLQWRAAELSRFYRRVRAELAGVRKDLPLYLAATDLLTNSADSELGRELQPMLPQKTTMADLLLHVGIDARHDGLGEGVFLIRPERISAASSLSHRAAELEIEQMPDADRYFQGLPMPGSLFFHEPLQTRIASFDEKCPFKPCSTWLASQPVPSAWQNRRRFVHSLATLDARVMFDGGRLLPMGQEESVRDLVRAYRQLPPTHLEVVSDPADPAAAQPVTIRCGTWGKRTYAYAVNDAPFAVTAQVHVDGPAGYSIESLPGARPAGPLRRDADGTYWEMELGPYDLVAASFSAPNVRLYRPVVSWPEAVRVALEQRLSELGSRAATLGLDPPLLDALENPSFDQPPGAQGQIPGWIAVAPPGVSVRLDKTSPHDGPQSVHLASSGPAAALISRAFAPPATGRLAVSVWLHTADAAQQPAVRVAIEGKMADRVLRRFAPFGRGTLRPIPATWKRFIATVNDLPLESLSAVWVRVELVGPGEVWIDDVQLCELAFDRREQKELLRLITPADVELRNGQIADCMRLLEGYWPRFLVEYVRLDERPVARPETASAPAQPPQEAERSSFMDRLKALVPRRLRF